MIKAILSPFIVVFKIITMPIYAVILGFAAGWESDEMD